MSITRITVFLVHRRGEILKEFMGYEDGRDSGEDNGDGSEPVFRIAYVARILTVAA